MTENYRQHLMGAINNLYEAEELLFTSALDLASDGQLSHLKVTYEEGDIMNTNTASLRSATDPNIQKLVALMTLLLDVAGSIKYLNKITDEELGWEEDGE